MSIKCCEDCKYDPVNYCQDCISEEKDCNHCERTYKCECCYNHDGFSEAKHLKEIQIEIKWKD